MNSRYGTILRGCKIGALGAIQVNGGLRAKIFIQTIVPSSSLWYRRLVGKQHLLASRSQVSTFEALQYGTIQSKNISRVRVVGSLKRSQVPVFFCKANHTPGEILNLSICSTRNHHLPLKNKLRVFPFFCTHLDEAFESRKRQKTP